MSASSSGCSGASMTQPRISPPAAVSAGTSSTSSDASRSKMRWCRVLWAMKSLNASAVVETAGNRDAEPGQLADHLAERGILAADLGQVGQSKVVQPQDVFGGSEGAQDGHSGLCRRWRKTGKGRRSRPKLAILAARAGKRPRSGQPPRVGAVAISTEIHGKTFTQIGRAQV